MRAVSQGTFGIVVNFIANEAETRMRSTSIHHIDYDGERRVLSIWFRPSGRRYDYTGVPPEIVEEFRRAGSKGRYFNTCIRDKYPTEWRAWERTRRPAVFPADGSTRKE